MAIYRKYTDWGRRIDIEKGEVYCPQCQGRGCKLATIKNGSYKSTIKNPCGFCQGYGKADWVQIATNEPRIDPPPGNMYIEYLKNHFSEYAAICIAREIDKEILNSLLISGQVATRMFYGMMKNYAKSVGVAVVTANQIKRMDLSKCVTNALEKAIETGSKEPKDQKINMDTSFHIQVIKACQS